MKNKIKSPVLNHKIEKIGLHTFLKAKEKMTLSERNQQFQVFINCLKENHHHSYYRTVTSPMDREVLVVDRFTGRSKKMLMFASNNYLGLANHPYVKKQVKKAINQYGLGVGGPPLLNGYSILMEELEERLAHLKQQESAMIFSTGFSANLGLTSGLAQKGDRVIYDALSHASFYDSLRLTDAVGMRFEHNNLADLEAKLQKSRSFSTNLFVGIEGVYSMDGDLAPLDKIIPLCREYGAYCWLDDAHGTGVLGARGSGTAEHFELEGEVDVAMGTFSKVFAVTGGFLAASQETINYLRYFARPYMFSAALPPVTLAAVLAGLDVIEKEPELRSRLLENSKYARKKLRPFGFFVEPKAAIIALKVPEWMDIRKANFLMHQYGIFLNAIEYPAVPYHEERFRISLMAQHTMEDIDRLAACLEAVWQDKACEKIDRV